MAAGKAEPQTIMIDATYLKAHRTASSLRLKKGNPEHLIGRTKGDMNTSCMRSLIRMADRLRTAYLSLSDV